MMRRILVCFALLAFAPISQAGIFDFASGLAAGRNGPGDAPGEQSVEVAFSPDGQAEALVLKVIHSARSSIRLAGYTFTSPAVVRALTDAKSTY